MNIKGPLVVLAVLCLEMSVARAGVVTYWTSFAGGKS